MNWIETVFWAGQSATVPFLSHTPAAEDAAEPLIKAAIGGRIEELPATQRLLPGQLVIREYLHDGGTDRFSWQNSSASPKIFFDRETGFRPNEGAMTARKFVRLMEGEARSRGVIKVSRYHSNLTVIHYQFVNADNPAYLKARALFLNPWRSAIFPGAAYGAVIGLVSGIVSNTANHEATADRIGVSIISGAISGGVSAALFSAINAMKGPKLAFGASFVASMMIEAGINLGYQQLKEAVA